MSIRTTATILATLAFACGSALAQAPKGLQVPLQQWFSPHSLSSVHVEPVVFPHWL